MNPLRPSAHVFAGIDFDRCRLFDTREVDEAEAQCGRIFSPHRLSLIGRERPLHMRIDHLPIGTLSVNRLSWQAAVAIDPGQLSDSYLLCLPTQSGLDYRQGPGTYQALPGQMVIAGGGERFHFTAAADFEQILLRLERSAVDAAWTALCGEAPTRPICFRTDIARDGPAWRALDPVLRLVADSARGEFDTPALRHLNSRLQDLLLTSLLLNQPHNQLQRRAPRSRATPACLKKAKAHMLDRLGEPLTLLAVAQAVGVPARTLQLAFQRADEMGPMQWLRLQRLHAVRAALLDAGQDGARVTELALRFGFTHLGEFSQQYRRVFDETPSATLARHG